MTGRMGSQCDINCVYGDELDDGSYDGCDGVLGMAVTMATPMAMPQNVCKVYFSKVSFIFQK